MPLRNPSLCVFPRRVLLLCLSVRASSLASNSWKAPSETTPPPSRAPRTRSTPPLTSCTAANTRLPTGRGMSLPSSRTHRCPGLSLRNNNTSSLDFFQAKKHAQPAAVGSGCAALGLLPGRGGVGGRAGRDRRLAVRQTSRRRPALVPARPPAQAATRPAGRPAASWLGAGGRGGRPGTGQCGGECENKAAAGDGSQAESEAARGGTGHQDKELPRRPAPIGRGAAQRCAGWAAWADAGAAVQVLKISKCEVKGGGSREYHCQQAFDQVDDAKDNGWISAKPLPVTAEFELEPTAPAELISVALVSGVGEQDHHVQDVEIRLKLRNGTLVPPRGLRLRGADKLAYRVVHGDRVQTDSSSGLTQIEFEPVRSVSRTAGQRANRAQVAAVQLTVHRTDSAKGGFVLNELVLEARPITPTSAPTMAPTKEPTPPPTTAPTSEMAEWASDSAAHSWSDNNALQAGPALVRGLWSCDPKQVSSSFELPPHVHLGLKLRAWAVGACPGRKIIVKVDGAEWWSSALGIDQTGCKAPWANYTGGMLSDQPSCFDDLKIRRAHNQQIVQISVAVEQIPGGPPMLLQGRDTDPDSWSDPRHLESSKGLLHGLWPGGAPRQVHTKLALPEHSKLQIHGRVWAVGSWAKQSIWLRVRGEDGKSETWWATESETTVASCGDFKQFVGAPLRNSDSVQGQSSRGVKEAPSMSKANDTATAPSKLYDSGAAITCYKDFGVTRPHTAAEVVVEFGSDIASPDAWWGFSSFELFADAVKQSGSWGFSALQVSVDEDAALSQYVKDAEKQVRGELAAQQQALALARISHHFADQKHKTAKGSVVVAEAREEKGKRDVINLSQESKEALSKATASKQDEAQAETAWRKAKHTAAHADANVTTAEATFTQAQEDLRSMEQDPKQRARQAARAATSDQIQQQKLSVADENQRLAKVQEWLTNAQSEVLNVHKHHSNVQLLKDELQDKAVGDDAKKLLKEVAAIKRDGAFSAKTVIQLGSSLEKAKNARDQQELNLEELTADVATEQGELKAVRGRAAQNKREAQAEDEVHAQQLAGLRSQKLSAKSKKSEAAEALKAAQDHLVELKERLAPTMTEVTSFEKQLEEKEKEEKSAQDDLASSDAEEHRLKEAMAEAQRKLDDAMEVHAAAVSQVQAAKKQHQKSKMAHSQAENAGNEEIRRMKGLVADAKDEEKAAQLNVDDKKQKLAAAQHLVHGGSEKVQKQEELLSDAQAHQSDMKAKANEAARTVGVRNAAWLAAQGKVQYADEQVAGARNIASKLMMVFERLQAEADAAAKTLQAEEKELEAATEEKEEASEKTSTIKSQQDQISEKVAKVEAKISDSSTGLQDLKAQLADASGAFRAADMKVALRKGAVADAEEAKEAADKREEQDRAELRSWKNQMAVAEATVKKSKTSEQATGQTLKTDNQEVDKAKAAVKKAVADKDAATTHMTEQTEKLYGMRLDLEAARTGQRQAQRKEQQSAVLKESVKSELADFDKTISAMKSPNSPATQANADLASKKNQLAKRRKKLAAANTILQNAQRLLGTALEAKSLAEDTENKARLEFRRSSTELRKTQYQHQLAAAKLAKQFETITKQKEEMMGLDAQGAKAQNDAVASKAQADSASVDAKKANKHAAQVKQQLDADQRALLRTWRKLQDARAAVRAQNKALIVTYHALKSSGRAARIDKARTRAGDMVQDAIKAAADSRKNAAIEAEKTLAAFEQSQHAKTHAAGATSKEASSTLREFINEVRDSAHVASAEISRGAKMEAEAKARSIKDQVAIMKAAADAETEEMLETAKMSADSRADGVEADASQREAEAQVKCDDENTPCLLQLAENPPPEETADEVSAAAAYQAAREKVMDSEDELLNAENAYKSQRALWQEAIKKATDEELEAQSKAYMSEAEGANTELESDASEKLKDRTDQLAASVRAASKRANANKAENADLEDKINKKVLEQKEAENVLDQDKEKVQKSREAVTKASTDVKKLQEESSDIAAEMRGPEHELIDAKNRVAAEEAKGAQVVKLKRAAASELKKAARTESKAQLRAKKAADRAKNLESGIQEVNAAEADVVKAVSNAKQRTEGAYTELKSAKRFALATQLEFEQQQRKTKLDILAAQRVKQSVAKEQSEVDIANDRAQELQKLLAKAKTLLGESVQDVDLRKKHEEQLNQDTWKLKSAISNHEKQLQKYTEDLKASDKKWQDALRQQGSATRAEKQAQQEVVLSREALKEAKESSQQAAEKHTDQLQVIEKGEHAQKAARARVKDERAALDEARHSKSAAADKASQAASKTAKREQSVSTATKKLETLEEASDSAAKVVEKSEVLLWRQQQAVEAARAALKQKQEEVAKRLLPLQRTVTIAGKAVATAVEKEQATSNARTSASETFEKASALVGPAEAKTASAKGRVERLADEIPRLRQQLSDAKHSIGETQTRIHVAEQAEKKAKETLAGAEATLSAATKAVTKEEVARKTSAEARKALLRKDTEAAKDARRDVDVAESKKSEAEEGINKSKMLVDSISQLVEGAQEDRAQLSGKAESLQQDEGAVTRAQSMFDTSMGEVAVVHQEITELKGKSQESVDTVEGGVRAQRSAVKSSQAELQAQQAKLAQITTEIDAHNKALSDQKDAVHDASKVLDSRQQRAEEARASAIHARHSFSMAESKARQQADEASAIKLKKGEAEVNLKEDLTPALAKAQDFTKKSHKVLAKAAKQLDAMQKEADRAQAAKAVSKSISDLVKIRKEGMELTSFPSLDKAPQLSLAT